MMPKAEHIILAEVKLTNALLEILINQLGQALPQVKAAEQIAAAKKRIGFEPPSTAPASARAKALRNNRGR